MGPVIITKRNRMIWPAWTQRTRTQNQPQFKRQFSIKEFYLDNMNKSFGPSPTATNGKSGHSINQSTSLINFSTHSSQLAPTAPPPVAPSPRESYDSDPEPFTGDLNKCRGFLLQCSLVFSQHPLTFPFAQSKVHYIVGLLGEGLWLGQKQ